MDFKRLYPGGAHKAITFSYDDGHLHDVRFLEIMNRNGLKGTFNLSSGWICKPTDGLVSPEKVKALYEGHEVAVHCVNHPFLTELSREEVKFEIEEDMRKLSELVGYPVEGMAYPYGKYDDTTLEIMKEAGIIYSRTCNDHGTFALPDVPYEWGGTCHHNAENLFELFDKFEETDEELALFYIWGHSFEFDRENKWDLAEKMCERAGKLTDTYFGTNMDILYYLNAVRTVKPRWGRVKNNSGIPVWIEKNGREYILAPGESV